MAAMNFDYVVSLGKCALHLPIKQIDGVKCCVRLEYDECRCNQTPIVRMKIYIENAEDNGNRIARNQEEFDEMIELLKNYKFDKHVDRFVDGRKYAPQGKEFYKCLESPTLTMLDECCVCLEMTRGEIYTCKHTICLRCVSNLKTNKCPLCREMIFTESEIGEMGGM